MSLSNLELVKLQHMLRDLFEDYVIYQSAEASHDSEDEQLDLSKFDPINFRTEIDGDSCLHIAAIRSDTEATRLLIKGDIDINLENGHGYTALDYALTRDNTDVVLLLLKNGGISKMSSHLFDDWITGSSSRRK